MQDQKITVTDQTGKTVCTITKSKTIKGALSEMKKSSLAFTAGMKIRIEYTII